jgi:hypothetical protein
VAKVVATLGEGVSSDHICSPVGVKRLQCAPPGELGFAPFAKFVHEVFMVDASFTCALERVPGNAVLLSEKRYCTSDSWAAP